MLIPAFLLGSIDPGLASDQLAPRAQLAPIFDTYIDPAAPTTNFGREAALVLGNRRAILIDFPQLQWQRYNGRKLKSATLILTFSRDIAAVPMTVSAVTKRWLEGENRVLRFDRVDPARIVWGQTTWNHAIQGPGGFKWADAGAKAATDSFPITDALTNLNGDKLEITGITQAIQDQIDNPNTRFGLRLESDKNVAFFSGDTGPERPELKLEWEKSTPEGADLALMTVTATDDQGNYLAIVKNVGTAESNSAQLTFSAATDAIQLVDVPEAIAPGATKTIRFASRKTGDPNDHRRVQLAARINANNDINPGNNALTINLSGRTIAFEASAEQLAEIKQMSPMGEPLLLYQSIIARLNNHVFPFSRSIQFPEGTFLRVNLALDPLAADFRVNLSDLTELSEVEILRKSVRTLIPLNASFRTPPSDAAPWINSNGSNLSWLPDTRDDGRRIPSLELPAPGFDTASNPVPLPEEGLISRSEVAFLQSTLATSPQTQKFQWNGSPDGILVRAFGAQGEVLKNTKVSFYRPGSNTPVMSGDSANSGLVFITGQQVSVASPFMEGQNNWLLAKAERNGVSATTWLPIWQVQEWFDRGNSGLASLELRFNIPSQPVDLDQNIASERIVTDSQNRFPAELAKLVDGNLEQPLTIAPNQWIEVDLGRDRMIAQINITTQGDTSSPLHIFHYGTSQSSSAAIRWLALDNLPFLSQLYGIKTGDSLTTPIINRTAQMRYVRFVNRGDKPIDLTEVEIFPVRN